jgi:hypothetical protein
MIAGFLPLADHGSLVSALPFVVPMVVVVLGLLVLVARDRLGRGEAAERREAPHSSA